MSLKMTTNDDIIIRRARPEDHKDLIQNGDVYGGKDYLTAMFLQILNDPDIIAMVAEINGRVVSFLMAQLLDGGMSVITRAGRTLPSYRKLGVMHKVGAELSKLTSQRWPDVVYSYSAIRSTVFHRAAPNLHEGRFVEILRKPILSYVYNLKDLKNMECQDGQLNVTKLSYDDIKTLFTLNNVIEKLFPLKRLFNFFIGYRCLESNIKHLLGDNKEVCITTRTPQPPQSDVTLSMLNDVDVVTFSEWWLAEAGLVYAVDAYAIPNRNGTSFPAHLLRHVRKVKEMKLCDKGIFVISLANLPEDELRSLLEHHGITEPLPGSEQWKALFEKQLRPK